MRLQGYNRKEKLKQDTYTQDPHGMQISVCSRYTTVVSYTLAKLRFMGVRKASEFLDPPHVSAESLAAPQAVL